MEAAELRAMSDEELSSRADDLRTQRARLTMQRNARRLEKTAQLARLRRDLARVLTVVRARRDVSPQGAS